MTSIQALCLALWTLISTASAISQPRDRGPLFNGSLVVQSLDIDGYEAMLNDSSVVWLVDYYSSWCAHCRMFAPEWEKVGKFYAQSKVVRVGAVDCNQFKELCVREEVHAYPAVKAHHVPLDGKASVEMEIRGRKRVKPVVQWVEEVLNEHGIKSDVDISTLIEDNNLREADPDGAEDTAKTELRDDISVEMKYNRLRDAGKAATLVLENSLFMGVAVLEGERYDAAVKWVTALTKSFPMEGNRLAFVLLLDGMKQQTRWELTEWSELLKKWRPIAKKMSFPVDIFEDRGDEGSGWEFCTTYTCGLWTLFHSMTVRSNDPSESWKPSDTMVAIRLYVENFFGCQACRDHFMAENPESVVEDMKASDSKGPHAVAMWAWKMHNAVNKVLQRGQWPSNADCASCYIDIGGGVGISLIQEDEMVAYLTRLYSHEDKTVFEEKATTKLAWLQFPMQGVNSLSAMVLLFAVVAVVVKTQKHRFEKDDHIA